MIFCHEHLKDKICVKYSVGWVSCWYDKLLVRPKKLHLQYTHSKNAKFKNVYQNKKHQKTIIENQLPKPNQKSYDALFGAPYL